MLGNIIGAIGSIAGGFLNNKAQKDINQQNLQFAKKQMQNKVQWTVEDAKKAGVHPLAALGANIGTVTPSAVASSGVGDGVAAGAAALGDAINAKEMAALQKEMIKSQIRQSDSVTSLNVARSRSVIASARAAAVNPGMPLVGKLKDTSTALRIGGADMPNAGNSDAEEVEAKYGDIVQNLYGIYNLSSDLWKGYRNSDVAAAQKARAREQSRNEKFKEQY